MKSRSTLGIRGPLIVSLIAATLLGAFLHISWLERSAPAEDFEEKVGANPPEPEPIGARAYDRLLVEKTGATIDGESLAVSARRAADLYEARLDELASALGAPDWRQVFKRLELDHPPDAQAVIETYRREIERQATFLGPLALFPEPERAVRVVANENPIFQRYFSLAMYLEGQLAVTLEAPDSTRGETNESLVNHCRVCIPPLVAHEVAPGHHVAYSAAAEVVPAGSERIAANRQNIIFHEGWALYAEHLMLELGYYQDPAAELGAVRLLHLRALRATIDPALHRGEIDREQAIELYREGAHLSTATAEVEVARHLKDPVLKASYFIGLHQILELRRLVAGAEPSTEQLRDFHHRFLGRPQKVTTIANKRFGVELPPWSEGFTQGESPY